MVTFILRRLVWCVVVVFLISILTFILYFVIPPVSPAVLFAGKAATPDQIEQAKASLGLNHSVTTQYYLFVRHLFLGDQYGWPGLGFSFATRESVLSMLGPRFVVTLTLGLGALMIWLLLGVSVGVIAAVRKGRSGIGCRLSWRCFCCSAPAFWLGLMFLWLFWYKLGIAPGTGYKSLQQHGFFPWVSHMIMPWMVLALLYAAWYVRMTRASVLDVLDRDFVLTARGKGLGERRVLFVHVLRAALTPMITMVGMDIAGLVSATVVIEVVFNLNGLGQFAINSVLADDIPSVLAVTLLGALTVTIVNLIVDVLYVYLDPRLRTESQTRVALP